MSWRSNYDPTQPEPTEHSDICEEQKTLRTKMNTTEVPEVDQGMKDEKIKIVLCPCKGNFEKEKNFREEMQKMLQMKEDEMNEAFQQKLEKKLQYLKDRFDHILRNEQIRSSNMLREAYRDRQEMISALRTQLECKNMAALMYVMCSERRKRQIEVSKLREEYTTHIEALQDILAESEDLILNLSRGYKTAARVDEEWRRRMKIFIKEFHNFINDFAGGCAEVSQYFLDIPELLKIGTSTQNNSKDFCDETEESLVEKEPTQEQEVQEKFWWDRLGDPNHPFVVVGDMAGFKPDQRREIIKTLKDTKTATKKWKEYVFNNTILKKKCDNIEDIKKKYKRHKPTTPNWEDVQSQNFKQYSETSRRVTPLSFDFRNGMGSIMKMIASNATAQVTKTSLLAAKDSFEIVSATRLRGKPQRSHKNDKLILNIGNKVEALFREINEENLEEDDTEQEIVESSQQFMETEEMDDTILFSALGSVHNDSLLIAPSHVRENDYKIHYGKVCPVEECQHRHMDDFMKTLPPYMQASPFMHFENTYEEYEACTPEQLKILEKRIEERKKREKVDFGVINNPLAEWTPSDEVMSTSKASMRIPPCNCRTPSPTPIYSQEHIFELTNIIPVKRKLDQINKEHFFDDNIQFDRFKVIGQDDEDPSQIADKRNKLVEIKEILEQHPSLCEIFENSVPC